MSYNGRRRWIWRSRYDLFARNWILFPFLMGVWDFDGFECIYVREKMEHEWEFAVKG